MITLEGFLQGIPVGSQGLSQDLVLFLLVNLLLWIIHVIIGSVVREVHNWLRLKVWSRFFGGRMGVFLDSEDALVIHHILEHLWPDTREAIGRCPQ